MPNIYQTYDQCVEHVIKRIKLEYTPDPSDPSDTELKIFCIKEDIKYNFRLGMLSPDINIKEWFRENIRNIVIVLSEIYDLDEKAIEDICNDSTDHFMLKININGKNKKKNKCQILSSIAICSVFTGIFLYFFN